LPKGSWYSVCIILPLPERSERRGIGDIIDRGGGIRDE